MCMIVSRLQAPITVGLFICCDVELFRLIERCLDLFVLWADWLCCASNSDILKNESGKVFVDENITKISLGGLRGSVHEKIVRQSKIIHPNSSLFFGKDLHYQYSLNWLRRSIFCSTYKVIRVSRSTRPEPTYLTACTTTT